MRNAKIKAVEFYLPEKIIDNEMLAKQFSDWTAEKIQEKTGIKQRHIAAADECASDLAYHATKKLFASGVCAAKDVEFILLCTQSPDYFLPTTACMLQDRLDISTSAGALDFNLGCSGYVYGLSLAKGLIETGQVNNVLLITAETYSKYMDDEDVSVRTIFGDAAAATFIELDTVNKPLGLNHFVFGTDGSGKENLIVKEGALRYPQSALGKLFMNGPEIFLFTIKAVPQAVNSLINKAQMTINDFDYFIFHQANKYMLSHLRDKINIPANKFYIDLANSGNTVSSSIPIAFKDALSKKLIKTGDVIALVSFGVGYSWAACLVTV